MKLSVSDVLVAVPTCAICSSAQDVEDGLQALNQAEASSDALFPQYRVAAQENLLDAATKGAGEGRVFPHRLCQQEQFTNHHTYNLSNS